MAARYPVLGPRANGEGLAHRLYYSGILSMSVGHAQLGVGKSPFSMRFSLLAVLRFAGLKGHTFASLSTLVTA